MDILRFSLFSITLNWIDFIFIGIILLFLLTNKGFFETCIEIGSLLSAIFFSYLTYKPLSDMMVWIAGMPRGISQVFGFFIVWFIIETFIRIVLFIIFRRLLVPLRDNRINRISGYFLSIVQACILSLFFITLVFSLPVKGFIKKDILESLTGPLFVGVSSNFESSIKNIFGDAITETLNFITVKPGTGETLDLGFKTKTSQLSNDESSEGIMISLLNTERTKVKRKTLIFDKALQQVAREYAIEMMKNGFFSHTSKIDNTTVSDRALRNHIDFGVVGENLAFAPDVYLAHQGLMNSSGHRKNILSLDYKKVGIGIIDGGVYGKMFVQVFSD
ncbi:MAG: CvpA family protein [Candidatus Roizmanbacteria bacterium]